MPHRLLSIIAGVLAIGAIGYLLFSYNQTPKALTLSPDDATVVALGKEVYARECAICHGANLEGQPNWRKRLPTGRLPAPPHDETGHSWHHADQLLIQITKFGPGYAAGPDYESDMPAYNDILTDQEIVAALSYIKSTWPARIRSKHDVINQRSNATQK